MRSVLICVALACIAPGVFADSRDSRKPINAVQSQLTQLREAREMLRRNSEYALRDGRGRTKRDDIEQWAYTSQVAERVEALIREAQAGSPAQAKASLAEAREALNAAMSRALQI